MRRTHTCGELKDKDIGKDVVLNGWVHSRRDHGGVIFVDLRDRYGLTQVVFNPGNSDFEVAEKLRREDVIDIEGKVTSRKEGMKNPNLPTGDIEVVVSKLKVLNKSEVTPIEVDDRVTASDDNRLRYRYLDLRRSTMRDNLVFRHKVAQATRSFLSKNNFLEIETPLLMKATPEGARDYVVPSRVNPGKFYALPQSPQIYKQLLMVSGMDRYFQIARCLRDEDLRADRQPEFTQIDIEMSFVVQDDILAIGEGLVHSIVKETTGREVKIPFQRMTFKESMDKYGNDKPDLRFGLELSDVTEIAKHSEFSVFKDVVSKGGIVKCVAPQADISRSDIDKYIAFCQELGAKGMAWVRVTENGFESNIAKFFSQDVQKQMLEKTRAKPGSILMFIADTVTKTNEVLSKLRLKLGNDLKLYDPKELRFCWILDFPLFEWNEDTNSWTFAHNPFTMPKREHAHMIETKQSDCYAECYDMVLNGVELASGSIRCHDPVLLKRVFAVVGYPDEVAEKRFGFLLESFKYGAPPHGGFAIGMDRFVAMLNGQNDIREFIAFPKNKAAQCPMDGSPSDIDPKSLKELHVKVDLAKK